MDNYKKPEWLYEQYIVLNRTIKSIYTECGVSHHTIESNLKKYGIRKTPLAPKLPTKDELIDLHHNKGIGIYSIAKMYDGVGVDTITKLMKQHGISILSSNDLHKKWWNNNDNKNNMSDVRRKLWQDDKYYTKTSAHLYDSESMANRARKFSATYQGVNIKDWKGFITPEKTRIRQSKEYTQWRKAVFERDDYTCQCCGARSSKHNPVFLHAHHLDSFADNPNLRFDIENGVTLCKNCHDIRVVGSFHYCYGTRNNTRTQYQDYLNKYRYELKESLHE